MLHSRPEIHRQRPDLDLHRYGLWSLYRFYRIPDSFQIKANIISDILNNIQNLYKVANKREVVKIQDEFFRIYNTEDMELLEKFNRELDVISEGYQAQSLR